MFTILQTNQIRVEQISADMAVDDMLAIANRMIEENNRSAVVPVKASASQGMFYFSCFNEIENGKIFKALMLKKNCFYY